MALAAANSKLFARASLFLVGLAWTLPFLQPVHRVPIPSFYGEWLAFALGLAAALLLLRRALWAEPVVPVVTLAPLLLIGLLVIQMLFGRVMLPELALTGALYLTWAVLLMVLGAALGRELDGVTITRTLAWSLVAGGVLNAIAGLIQHYHPPGVPELLVAPKFTVAVYGNVGQANHFADYIALALASTAYLYARGALRAHWAAIGAVLFLLVFSLSGSRSPWIYLGTLAALALWFVRARSAECERLFRFSLYLLPGLFIGNWFVTLPFMIPETGGLMTSGERWFEVASGIDARVQLAREAWAMFAESPLLGAGWGQFSWHHFQYEALTGARAAHGVYNHAHNLVLQLMAETGAAGALAVTGAALAWLWDRRVVTLDPEHWWLLAVLSVLAVHSLLELPLWYSNFLGIAAVLLGAGARRFMRLEAVRVARVAIVAVVAIGGLNLVWVLDAYRNFERLLFSMPKRMALVPDAKTITGEVLEVHRDPILTYYVEVAVSPGIAISDEQLRDKLELSARVMRFSPGDLEVYRHALLLALAGEREPALRHLERAALVYPDRLPFVIATIRELARPHPDKFNPLLESALAKHGTGSAPVVTR